MQLTNSGQTVDITFYNTQIVSIFYIIKLQIRTSL